MDGRGAWVFDGDAVVYASRVADRRHRRESWQTVSKRLAMACPWDSGWGTRKTYILAIVWRCKSRGPLSLRFSIVFHSFYLFIFYFSFLLF